MDTIRWVWKYVRPYLTSWIWASFLTVIVSLLFIVSPYIGGRLVDIVINDGRDDLLISLLIIMMVSILLQTILRYFSQMRFEAISQEVLFKIREDLYAKLNSLDFNFFKHTRIGDIMARMTGDTDAIRHGVAWVYFNVLDNIILFITALILMGTIEWRLMLSLLIVTPFIVIFTVLLSSKASRAFFEVRESFSYLNSLVEENIRGNKVVKAFANEAFEIEKFDEGNERFKKSNMDSTDVSKRYLPLLETIASFMSVIAIGLGGWFVINNQMTVGDLVTFTGLIWMINIPMRNVGGYMNDLQRMLSGTIKIREMLMAEPRIPVEKQKVVKKVQGTVEFENVSFAFPDDPEHFVLNNISFKAEAGETVGILGETGSGKSTMINLISRFYDPTEGRVLIDDVDIRDWNVIELRKHITVVMQDAFLFSDTIRSNISYGDPHISMDYIQEMAEIADASEFIEKMPDKYETYLGEQGSGLSGGQKQRLSLARGLVKNPSILILDDTTSAVDMETEVKIQEGMEEVSERRTTFIIANRISSVKDADQIIILAKGKIIEHGKHEDLLDRQGVYYRVYQEQLGQLT